MGIFDRLGRFFSNATTIGPVAERTTGAPQSANGASSFHLFWEMPAAPLAEVSATIEVVEPPSQPHLFFWALQASFVGDGGRPLGAGHFGLQYHPDYPSSGAVNWGGYHHGGGELDGSTSALGSTLGNPNTSDYLWAPGVRYRYRIARSPQWGWRGTITNLETDQETVVRDLYPGGSGPDSDANSVETVYLAQPMVWAEVFAPCDAPSVTVAWSDLSAVAETGETIHPSAVTTNYQRYSEGGCTNTDSTVDRRPGRSLDGRASDGGQPLLIQRTNTERRTPAGTRIPLSSAAP